MLRLRQWHSAILMKKFLSFSIVGLALFAIAPATSGRAAPAETILFIGNSFTYGANSPVWRYRANSVDDLNHDGVGGVPALFKLFTEEVGLNYAVSLETAGGKSLKWHWENKQFEIGRPWNHVVLQEYSTLDPDLPGNPTNMVAYAKRLADLLVAKNPAVEISLTATWSRPDQTHIRSGYWYGRPITKMALDVRRGADMAARSSPAIDRVHAVGEAFNCAITAGVAAPDPYDGVKIGEVDLWSYDNYHASTFGYYLEALVIFGDVTGKDPRALGPHETAAEELGLSPADAVRLQRIAWLAMHGAICNAAALSDGAVGR